MLLERKTGMKTKKTKTKKIIAAILSLVLIGIVLFLANGMVGNPFSKMLANKAAEKYITKNYSDLDLELEKAFYSFKDGRYHVNATSTSSIDTHFTLSYSWAGKLEYDDYEDLVLSKWNTFQRIDSEYRKLVDAKFENKMDLDERDFMYGELAKDDDFSDLELDKKYDVKELAEKQGHIQLTMETDTRNIEAMAKILTKVKKIFDEEDIPFTNINVDLSEPRREDASQEDLLTAGYLMIQDFLYSDIYPDGLEKRIEDNIKETKRYYQEQNQEKIKTKDEFEVESKDKN